MPRPIWKGSLRFGLVNIPVGLYPAESPDDLDLDLLDRRDLAPVGYKKYNKKTGKELKEADIVKAYPAAKNKYVVLGESDLKRANPEAAQTVDIFGFIDRDAVEPVYFDRPYYVAPDGRGAAKAYALLREALERSGRMALARIVIRTRQYVAAVYPLDRVLVVNLLRFHHELRDPAALDLPAAGAAKLGLTGKELDLAERLIADMEETWKPESYKDEYRDDLLALIRRKGRAGARGAADDEAAEEAAAPRKGAEVVDLMALLQRSVGQKRRAPRAAARRSRPVGSRRKTA
ncbi:MAG TPA: Ku protein [Thermoanaerobaculia bacterium]|nr:Ku protein [Thermoanaerobaculia bacterium]